jgi:hypothetical protein
MLPASGEGQVEPELEFMEERWGCQCGDDGHLVHGKVTAYWCCRGGVRTRRRISVRGSEVL